MTGRTEDMDLKWEKRTWKFIAKDKTTVLEIRTAMPATAKNTYGGPAIDNVSVVEIN